LILIRYHAHLATNPLLPCREATSPAQESAARRWNDHCTRAFTSTNLGEKITVE
jgi:hypothetical protein